MNVKNFAQLFVVSAGLGVGGVATLQATSGAGNALYVEHTTNLPLPSGCESDLSDLVACLGSGRAVFTDLVLRKVDESRDNYDLQDTSGLAVILFVQVLLQGTVRIAPRTKVKMLPSNFLAPATRRMEEQREIRIGLLWLVLARPSGRLGHASPL